MEEYKSPADGRVPRDPVTERRCQYFSIIVSIVSLISIFAFAITYPYANPVPINTQDEALVYRTLCPVSDVIPKMGTAICDSTRSRLQTIVTCDITCDRGINEKYRKHLELKAGSDNQFVATCTNTDGWDLVKTVNDLCISDMTNE